jgi:hypothetical protein
MVSLLSSSFGPRQLPVTESSAPAFMRAERTMEQSYFREEADRCRRLARDSTDPVLQVSLRRLADDYQMKADELENDEILAKRADPND